MRTFSIQTLGCKVNQYESEQLAAVLRGHGLVQVEDPAEADLRVVNTCSVTVQAASKSRQLVRRNLRQGRGGGRTPRRHPLPVIQSSVHTHPNDAPEPSTLSRTNLAELAGPPGGNSVGQRVLVTGCWATSDRAEAVRIAGSDAVLTHHEDVAVQLNRLLTSWTSDCDDRSKKPNAITRYHTLEPPPSGPLGNDGWMNQAGIPAGQLTTDIKASPAISVNNISGGAVVRNSPKVGTTSLPLLDERQTGHQRAFLKIQDGCDARCTYCIIPSLRPRLWSKPVDAAVEEAKRLVAAGHMEIVLTGIFLGAYGRATALRRRQDGASGAPIADLIDALCTRVPGLRRLRLSSLEPGDLTPALVAALKAHAQVVPHFHLPLQSGSDAILRRMNRQYTRDDYLRMIDRVGEAFDRPAMTTDVIVAFPGETEREFRETMDVVDRARFVHVHAFPFSPRPGTAAARWKKDFVHGPVINERINLLAAMSAGHGYAFRRQFAGEVVEVLVERPGGRDGGLQHGRCERYFAVHFEHPQALVGRSVRVRVERVTPARTFGVVVA